MPHLLDLPQYNPGSLARNLSDDPVPVAGQKVFLQEGSRQCILISTIRSDISHLYILSHLAPLSEYDMKLIF